MARLIFDIETIGENFDAMDETTQHMLTRWTKQESKSEEEYRAKLTDIKNGLGFSPLTGEIVAIGMVSSDADVGAVYFQAPGMPSVDFEENGIKYKVMNEKEMLEAFWKIVQRYDGIVSFNGRSFDVPYLVVRSAIHGIKPSRDFMGNRYLQYQKTESKHIDLYDQLSFYGATRMKGSLHLWCRAFGIESPKTEGVTGDDVTKLFAEKQYETIARYNMRDIISTKKLYKKWETYFQQ